MESELATDLIISTHIALPDRTRSREMRAGLEKTAERLIKLLVKERRYI